MPTTSLLSTSSLARIRDGGELMPTTLLSMCSLTQTRDGGEFMPTTPSSRRAPLFEHDVEAHYHPLSMCPLARM